MKKKKESRKIVYVTELHKWLTHRQYCAYVINCNNEHKEEEFTPIVESISYFIEESKGRRCDTDDMQEYLIDEGFSKKTRESVSLKEIQAAYRCYKIRHPYKPKLISYEEFKQQEQSKTKRKKIWGINISAILRCMGKEGFSFEEAKIVMKYFEVDVEESTIRGQLWCGTRRGKYGEIPELQDWQLNELYAALSK